jgi:uncharacterized protein YprB with RNaseH-like and TPR domain
MNRLEMVRNRINRLPKEEKIAILSKRCKHRHSMWHHPNCFPDSPMTHEKIGFLDIETTDLKADFGYMLTWCIGGEGEITYGQIKPSEIKKGTFDKRIVAELTKCMCKYDRLITHYGTKFDLPFIRSRAIKHGVEFPAFGEINHTDTWFMSKKLLKLRNNRLETICNHFGIASKGHRLIPDIWQRALAGDQKSLDFVLTHNAEDVESLEKVYILLKKYYRELARSI